MCKFAQLYACHEFFLNIYGPNIDTPLFYTKVSETMEYFNNQSIILTGDYNLVQNQRLDTYNYVGIKNPKVLDMIEIYNLTDPFRELYPDLKRDTWRKRTPLRYRPFNLKGGGGGGGGGMVFCFVQNFFSDNTTVRIFFFFVAQGANFFSRI